jgi:two-component system LytT family sensor kinase
MTVLPKGSAARILALGIGLATAFALSITTQTYLAMINHGHAFWRILTWQLAGWVYWAAVAPWIVLRLCAGLGRDPVMRRDYVAPALAAAPAIAGHFAVGAAFMLLLQPYVPVHAYAVGEALGNAVRSHVLVDLLIYGGLVAVGRMLAVSERARQLALREAQLEGDLVRARLDALRLEIQPHFLFNTLNAIAALIRIRANDQALKMLLGLSELMRGTLDRAPAHLTPLGLEVEFTRRYIELQQVRFGDRLDVRYAIDPAAEGCLVPAFLLQPIVENAFRHGIGGKAGSCRLELSATFGGGRVQVRVSDDGAGLLPGFSLDRHAGTGLRNVRTRLQNLYGAPAVLRVENAACGGTVVSVDLPSAPPADLAQATA